MEAKEKGATLDAEAEAFLADVECTAPYDEPMAMITTNMFQANHEDAYDLDVDEGSNANVAFMANLTSKDINEVHSDDNHIFDNVNHQLAQEMHQEEHLGFDDEYDFLTNTIPYKKPSLVSDTENVSTEASAATTDQIAMIAILNNLTSQVVGHAKTNQEITLENETLKNELVSCKQEIAKDKSIEFLKSKKEKVLTDKKELVDSYLDDIVSLQSANRVTKEMLQRFNMPTHTIPMLSKKPRRATADLHQDILGPPPSQVLASLHLVKVVFPQFESIIIERTYKKHLYISVACFDYAKEFAEQQLSPFYEHFKKHIEVVDATIRKEVAKYKQIFDDLDTESQQAATRNRGKAIFNSSRPTYDQEPSMVDDDDDETSKDNEIDKLMALISLSFKKIYKPTNNNLRTSSNTSRANQDNSSRIHRNAGYEHQRLGNVAGARETVSSTVVQKSRIQCYNRKEYGNVARECQKPKRAKDAAYHREKMLL
nr:hypothetical protein [Tanacetum cinerariifolium]